MSILQNPRSFKMSDALDMVETFKSLPDQMQIDMLRQIVSPWSMYGSGYDQIADGLDYIESEIRSEDDAAMSARPDMMLGMRA